MERQASRTKLVTDNCIKGLKQHLLASCTTLGWALVEGATAEFCNYLTVTSKLCVSLPEDGRAF